MTRTTGRGIHGALNLFTGGKSPGGIPGVPWGLVRSPTRPYLASVPDTPGNTQGETPGCFPGGIPARF